MLVFAGTLAGCAKPPSDQATLTTAALPAQPVETVADQAMPPTLAGDATSAGPVLPVAVPGPLAASTDNILTASIGTSKLAGRTLRIGSIADLKKLKPGEVILTFDDGPSPAYTPKILATLKDYGVKATFFMVGKMAKAHPEIAQLVAAAGHTIGSHTHGHENLKAITFDAAVTSVSKADTEISDAIKPTGKKLAPFFRFPYLNATKALYADLADSGVVVFGVDVDSWDYLNQSTDHILKRTLRRLDAKGKGIVLFHDIHARTTKVLPKFLDALEERGYKVVRAMPKSQFLFDLEALVAAR